jgi:hypothetical protein
MVFWQQISVLFELSVYERKVLTSNRTIDLTHIFGSLSTEPFNVRAIVLTFVPRTLVFSA